MNAVLVAISGPTLSTPALTHASWRTGRRYKRAAPKGNRVLRQILCEVANAACKTKSQFKGKYQALVIRRGHKRSIIALGHKILRVMYAVLSSQQPYRDPEIDYEALVVAKNAPRWLKALEKYGYVTKLRPLTA